MTTITKPTAATQVKCGKRGLSTDAHTDTRDACQHTDCPVRVSEPPEPTAPSAVRERTEGRMPEGEGDADPVTPQSQPESLYHRLARICDNAAFPITPQALANVLDESGRHAG